MAEPLARDVVDGHLSEADAHVILTLNVLYAVYELAASGRSAWGSGPANASPLWLRPEVHEALQDGILTVRQLIQATIEPVLQAVAAVLASTLATIHTENYASAGCVPAGGHAVRRSR